MQVNASLIPGTTCATVLTQAILTEGCKSIAAGVNVMDLRNGINKAVDAVITDLKSRALMISTPEEITQVQWLLKKKFPSLSAFWLRQLIYCRDACYLPSILIIGA